MVKDRRATTQFRAGLSVSVAGLVTLVIIVFLSLLPHDKTRPDLAAITTALATLGLLATAVSAAIIGFVQFKNVQRADKIERTTDLLREWSKPRMQYLLGFIDSYSEPADNIKFARRFYKLFDERGEQPHQLSRKKRTKYLKRKRKIEQEVHNAIQELSLMATRTWNLLDQEVIDEEVLFGQLDYDILSTYIILQEVLNRRSEEDNYLYNEFTLLARRAQQHYKRRPYEHVVDEFVDAKLPDLSVGH
jgi:hypothetical protein